MRGVLIMWTDRLVILTRPVFHTTLVGDCLRWTDRLDITCLGRCSCTNQVSSVSLSVLCCQRMDISPVTQKKKKKKQLVIRPSQASIMPSRLRSVTGQLAACPSWAGCMWPSRCWQLLCGIMPRFRGHQSSCSIRSAASSATMWHQHSKAATAMLAWP